jgi:hypothetical protein
MPKTRYSLGTPYIDIDEQRPEPLPHRYVHGGFEGNETRFSFYFPPAEQYGRRFIQVLEGGLGGNENIAQSPMAMGGTIPFAFECGAYLVESNQGHHGADQSGSGGDRRIHGYIASAESARFSRELAAEMYGTENAHGYIFGGSGGGRRSISCIENGSDVWDGAVPFMPGSLEAQFVVWSVVARAIFLLRPKIVDIIDAMEPGGSGNPFVEGLTSDQREALAALYRIGFPRGAEWALLYHFEAVTLMCWGWYAPQIVQFDRAYFEEDFWKRPGYAGADNREEIEPLLVDETAKITSIARASDAGNPASSAQDPDSVVAIGIDRDNMDALLGARLRVQSGAEAGRERYCVGIRGNMIQATALSNDLWGRIAVGDEIGIDNRHFLAYCHWHRHQVGTSAEDLHRLNFGELSQFAVDGSPIYPQRPMYATSSGDLPKTGRFAGKMILLQHTLDAAAWPNPALIYQEMVRAHHGSEVDDHFRLWWTENASHMPPTLTALLPPTPPPVRSTRLVDYVGIVQQAVRDLIAWVEDGVAPAPSTSHRYTSDHRLILAAEAVDRHGIQPVVKIEVNGRGVVEVEAGTAVTIRAHAECPPGGGSIISIECDFDGSGSWPLQFDGVDGTSASAQVETTHIYKEPGTYFPSVRVTAHRDGDVTATSCQASNLGRARVRVTAG